jgi:hypothetical protein
MDNAISGNGSPTKSMAKENTPGQMGITTRAAIRMGKEKASER